MDWSRLLEILVRTSFKSESEALFRLASGRMSNFYVDCKQALSDPEARELIGKLLYERLRALEFETVGGLELGAYPIATSASDAIYRASNKKVRAFVIRKQAKSHGVGKLIAGDAISGDTAVIVDDVITTGGSTIEAIKGAREAGLIVNHVIVMVDRQEDDGMSNIQETGVTCESLFTLKDLIRAKANASTATSNTYQPGTPQAKSA